MFKNLVFAVLLFAVAGCASMSAPARPMTYEEQIRASERERIRNGIEDLRREKFHKTAIRGDRDCDAYREALQDVDSMIFFMGGR